MLHDETLNPKPIIILNPKPRLLLRQDDPFDVQLIKQQLFDAQRDAAVVCTTPAANPARWGEWVRGVFAVSWVLRRASTPEECEIKAPSLRSSGTRTMEDRSPEDATEKFPQKT